VDLQQTKSMLVRILSEVRNADGSAAIERYPGLRDVDAKVREARALLQPIAGAVGSLFADFSNDADFQANSRRVRLEALANYCQSAVRFIDSGGGHLEKAITPCPSLSKLTTSTPGLEGILTDRWAEAQKCQNAGAFLAAVVMMGSILEGLLLAVAHDRRADCYKAAAAPRRKDGTVPPIQDWKLSQLIDVAVELGLLKTDRGKFGHALRDSRNVVHPWQHMATAANYDEATCRTCWHVLNASIEDLLAAP
jgi:hypothetical protein